MCAAAADPISLADRAWRGDASVRDPLTEVAARAERSGDARVAMAACLGLAMLALREDDGPGCDAWIDRGLVSASFDADPKRWAALLNFRAQRQLAAGRPLSALGPLLAVVDRAPGGEVEAGHRAQARANLGATLYLLGDPVAAIELIEEAVADAKEIAPRGPLGQVAALAAVVHLEQGASDAGLELLRTAEDQLGRLEGRPRQRLDAMVRRARAWALWRAGSVEAARDEARAAFEALSPFEDSEELASCVEVEVRALRALGDLDDALSRLDVAEALADAAAGDAVLRRILRLRSEIAEERGDVAELARMVRRLTDPERTSRREAQAVLGVMRAGVSRELAHSGELSAVNAALRQTVDALASARDDAVAQADGRQIFLAQMSHELRTPLQGVLGSAELLRAQLELSDNIDLVDVITRSARLTLSIVDDILDLGKLEVGQVQMEKGPFSPRRMVSDVVRNLRGRAADKRLCLEVDEYVPDVVRGDGRRLSQVLYNLAGNALKFAAGEVTVRVCLADRDDVVRFEVIDDGMGIPADLQARLFDPYVQGHQTRGASGTGLGLAIAKRLVEGHDGTIGVHSVLGSGSTFWVEVPLPEASSAPVEDEDDGDLLGLRVLLAEDNEVSRMILERQLRGLGADPVVVADGTAALDALQKSTFDLAFLDLNMPGLDGDEVAREARRTGVRTPLLALTASVLEDDRKRCVAAGMNAVLTKPLARGRLLDVVAALATRSVA